ncbi:hypothetical protein H1R20_g4440, partial [Candolleomyces eurysporus]
MNIVIQVDPEAGWKLLLDATAPNALYNSTNRFDPPKCDEDTRIEVTEEIMDWIQDCESPQRLLCMTGAAGAGKSALQQTISELCSKKDILGSTFFFSSTDPTRNTASALIATMAYQLGLGNVELRREMGTAVAKDPLIFTKSLKTQMETLIVAPFDYLRCNSKGSELSAQLRNAILIDGLDECTDEQRQAEVLSTIHECLIKNENMPFRIFIASRPEWAIRSALEQAGYLHQVAYHIRLSDDYNAFSDIERVLWRRLREIGRKSSDPRARSPEWPSKEIIEAVCKAASGQFIYAATVIKFVSDIRSSPVDRLQIVLTWTPDKDQRAKPFASLDYLYTNILSRAKEEYEASNTDGHDFLLLIRVYQLMHRGRWGTCPELSELAEFLDLEANAHERLLWDLRSLITTVTPRRHLLRLHFYHKSFHDFLDKERRSMDLFVPEGRADRYVATLSLRYIEEDLGDSATNLPCFLLSSFINKELWPAPSLHPIFLEGGMSPIDRLEKVDRWIDVFAPHSIQRGAVLSWVRILARYIRKRKAGDSETEEFAAIQRYHEKWEKTLNDGSMQPLSPYVDDD